LSWPIVALILGAGLLALGAAGLFEVRARRKLDARVVEQVGQVTQLVHRLDHATQTIGDLQARQLRLETAMKTEPVGVSRQLPKIMR
jgi:hypothetical protein